MEKGKLRDTFKDFEVSPASTLEASIFSQLQQKKKRRAILWWCGGSGISGLLLVVAWMVFSGKPGSQQEQMVVSEKPKQAQPVTPKQQNLANSRPKTSANAEVKNKEVPATKDPDQQRILTSGFKPRQTAISEPQKTLNPGVPGPALALSKDNNLKSKLLHSSKDAEGFSESTIKGIVLAKNNHAFSEDSGDELPDGEIKISETTGLAAPSGEVEEKSSNPAMARTSKDQTPTLDSVPASLDSAHTTRAKLDSGKATKKTLFRTEMVMGLAYAFFRDIYPGIQAPAEFRNANNIRRSGLQGSRFMPGILLSFLPDKTLSAYLNVQAGYFTDNIINNYYQALPGNYIAELKGNSLLLTPRLDKIDEEVRVQTLISLMTAGLRYRFQNGWEIRSGGGIRLGLFTKQSTLRNGIRVESSSPYPWTGFLEAGISKPLRHIPEKWGKFRLELCISQDGNPANWMSKNGKLAYSFAELRLIRGTIQQ